MITKTRLKEFEIKTQDLAKALECSRPTLDEYIRKYEYGEGDKLPINIRNVLKYINESNYVSMEGIKVRFYGASESRPLGEDNPLKWETRLYITSDNIRSLLKEIRQHHQVEKRRDGTYRFIIDKNNVVAHFVLVDSNDYDKNQKLHIYVSNSMPVKSYEDILSLFKDAKDKAIFLYKKKVAGFDIEDFPPLDLDEVIEEDSFEDHIEYNEDMWNEYEQKKHDIIYALNGAYYNSPFDLEKLNKMASLLSQRTSGFTIEWQGKILAVLRENKTGKYYLCYIADYLDPTSPSNYEISCLLEGGEDNRQVECRIISTGDKGLIDVAKYIESRAKYLYRK